MVSKDLLAQEKKVPRAARNAVLLSGIVSGQPRKSWRYSDMRTSDNVAKFAFINILSLQYASKYCVNSENKAMDFLRDIFVS